MRYFLITYVFAIIAAVAFLGLPGQQFRNPPIWVFPDMDIQARYKPQGPSEFFSNGTASRPVVPGTVARGYEWELDKVFSEDFAYEPAKNPPLYTGKDENGEWYRGFPVEVDLQFIQKGREKFEIFCAVCHGFAGDGNGITKVSPDYEYTTVKTYFSATPSYHMDLYRDMAEGEIFNTITHGKNTMMAYGMKLTPRERWAVIAYLRALQRSQNATLEDVPEPERANLNL